MRQIATYNPSDLHDDTEAFAFAYDVHLRGEEENRKPRDVRRFDRDDHAADPRQEIGR